MIYTTKVSTSDSKHTLSRLKKKSVNVVEGKFAIYVTIIHTDINKLWRQNEEFWCYWRSYTQYHCALNSCTSQFIVN